MPTGYTAGVADGSITSFKDYALMCARAFGASLHLRDESLSIDLPEEEESTYSTYYNDKLRETQAELDKISSMSESDLLALYKEEHDNNISYINDRISENNLIKDRYTAMLEFAKRFNPPSDKHINYCKFLISQLKESIDFDCDISYYEKQKKGKSFAEWLSDKKKDLNYLLAYYQEQLEKETERINSNNKWIRDLKEALDSL